LLHLQFSEDIESTIHSTNSDFFGVHEFRYDSEMVVWISDFAGSVDLLILTCRLLTFVSHVLTETDY